MTVLQNLSKLKEIDLFVYYYYDQENSRKEYCQNFFLEQTLNDFSNGLYCLLVAIQLNA